MYYVTVTDAFGCSSSDTVLVNIIAGLEENMTADKAIRIYPNPSSDHSFTVSFELSGSAGAEVRIYNQLGATVYSEKIGNVNGTYLKKIDLQDVPGGMYFVNVIEDGNGRMMKLSLN